MRNLPKMRRQQLRVAGAAAVLLLSVGCSDRPLPVESPVQVDGAERLIVAAPQAFTQVAAGFQYGCGLQEDGVIKCWGLNDRGGAPPTRAALVGHYTQVTAGNGFSCGLRNDGVAECFGSGTEGTQAGVYPATPPHQFTQLSNGSNHVCGLRSDGSVECWGDNDFLQAPATVSSNYGTFTQVSGGGGHSCALASNGFVECWGDNSRAAAPAVKISVTTAPFIDVSAGSRHTCAVVQGGAIECWGDNLNGQAPPGPILALSGSFVQVRAGNNQTCALRDDGVVQCWGDDTLGSAPATITAGSGSFASIDHESVNGCGLRTDGAAQCWGLLAGTFTANPGTTRVNPVADFAVPSSVIIGQPIPMSLDNARVPGYPSATSFTYAFDCGAGYGAAGAGNAGSCPTSVAGQRAVKGMVIDQDGDQAEYTATVTVLTVVEGATGLQWSVAGASLSPDLRKPLLAKLNAALAAMAKGKTAAACSALADFINQVNAQRGKAIATATADAWIVTASQLRAALGC